jgi:hypothetical protein
MKILIQPKNEKAGATRITYSIENKKEKIT